MLYIGRPPSSNWQFFSSSRGTSFMELSILEAAIEAAVEAAIEAAVEAAV